MSNIMSIDPSINHMGMAIFNDKKLYKYELLEPPKSMINFILKSLYLFGAIKRRCILHKVNTIVIEIPQYLGVSGFAARESGSIGKLMFICGMICTLQDYNDIKVITYTPNDWKGQMTKEVVANRLQRIYKDIDFKKLDNNIADAIGIGHKYIFGKV